MTGSTATYGSDFVADGATLTFSPGQTRRSKCRVDLTQG